jgi:acyl carrier protein
MSDELTDRTRDTVLALAREITQEEMTEDVDPLSAGLDSIATMELAARIEEELGIPCTIEDVFDTPSFAALAQSLAQRIEEAGVR